MVKPAQMTKVSVTGSKNQLQKVIDTLYELELLDIEDYEGGELEKGEPFEDAEDISELLVDVRSILSKLPDSEVVEEKSVSLGDIQENLGEIKSEVDRLEDRRDEIEKERSRLEDQEEFFSRLRGTDLTYEDLQGTDSLEVFIGRMDVDRFKKETGSSHEILQGEDSEIVFYRREDAGEVEKVLREVSDEQYSLVDTDFTGTIEEILQAIEYRREELEEEIDAIEEGFKNLAKKWGGKLENAESFLAEKVEKSEAPIRFATTKRTFIAEGWVPTDSLDQLRKRLNEENGDKIHIETEEGENPPVKQENNQVVEPFESLTDLVDVPRYNEVDPSFLILLTFPLFFGMMIGDAGYGISSAIVFFAGMKMFPKASELFKALLWTSAATLLFGLLYGEMFGFRIYESPFYRAYYWTEILYLTVLIGLAHVNLALLIGAYNEYVRHGLLAAVYEKISWILLQAALVAGYLTGVLYGSTAGWGVLLGLGVPSLMMLYKGEGIAGIVEIPALISNILSYLRLFGVCMAAYTLAGTANAIASPAYASGTLMGIVAGTLILMVGHTILTFIKIMEGFIQGIRLHYVEMFGWFFEGGGRKYAPFGADR